MRNTILKKIKANHSKNNSNNYKNNKNINKKKIRSKDSNLNYNSNNDNLIDDNNIIDNEDNFLTIEKENNDNFNINMEKIRALSNNLNNCSKLNNNKKQYIFIKKDNSLFEKNISPKKNNKKEIIININDSNTHLNNINKTLLQKENKENKENRENKENKENFITVKKSNNNKNNKKEDKKLIASKTKEKTDISNKNINTNSNINIKSKKKFNKSIEIETNNTKNNKNLNINNNDSYTSLNEIVTIKDDESIDSDSSFEKVKNEIRKKKIKIEQEIEKKIDLLLKETKHIENNNNITKNKYKENDIKRNIKLNTKKRNINNNRNIKMFEEEKTIVYKNDKNNIKDIKIMNYFQKLIRKHNNDHVTKSENNQELRMNIKTNENNQFKNNIVNSEKKIISQNIEFFHNEEVIKNEELNKKLEHKKTKGNNKKININNILDKNEITKNQKKQNNIVNNNNIIISNNVSNDKTIKTNIISKKRLNEKTINSNNNVNIKCNNNNNNEEDINKNTSNNSINNINLKSNKVSKKETKNSSDYSNKKNELKQLGSNIFFNSLKKSNILLINNISNNNNNNSEDKIKANSNSNSNKNLNNIKNISRLKSMEKTIKNDLSNKESISIKNTNHINLNNNIVNYKFTTKKNKTYFISNNGTKVFNNSSNNIHKLQKNEMIKNNNKNNITKKINNKINNNIQISNYINIDYISQIKNNMYINNNINDLINSFRISDNYLKRSISPHINNTSFYPKIQNNKLVIMSKKPKQNNNNNKRKEYKFNSNNLEHKEFFKNEEVKNNLNIRYTSNINNTETYFYLNDTIIDLSKSRKNKNNYLFNNNNCFTYTKGNKHISPINNFKTQKMFSSFCSKINNKENKNTNNNIHSLNSTYNINKRSSAVLKNKNIYKKNKIKINVDNILNTNFNSSIYINKIQTHLINNEKGNIQTLSNKKKSKNYINKNVTTSGSFIDLQIPLVPEENVQVISLKTMKYNQFFNSNQLMFFKLKKIFRNDKIMNIILLYLNNNDIFNLSLVNHLCFKITIKRILKIIMNKIITNINNKKLIEKIWNIELLKYSNFHYMKNFDIIYKRYKQFSNKYDNDIIKDLLRTFPNDVSFHKGSEYYNKLFNILKAYSNYNSEIGYAQGMNFIVAKLIIFFKNEKKSFIYLDSLFNKLNMENVIGISNNLENKMKIVQFLLKKLCPDIIKYLERKKINHEIFTASWFITLFSKNFKFDNILMVIWNFSIIFGWKFIFLFSISVIIIFKDKYFDLDLYEFTQYMKNIFIFEHFKKKFNDIMKLTFYYMSQWKNIINDIKKECLDDIDYKMNEKININTQENNELFFKSFNKFNIEKEVEDKETSYFFP